MLYSPKKILKNVDCFLVDLDGTIYKGDLLLSGSKRLIDTIKVFKKGLFIRYKQFIDQSQHYRWKIDKYWLTYCRWIKF